MQIAWKNNKTETEKPMSVEDLVKKLGLVKKQVTSLRALSDLKKPSLYAVVTQPTSVQQRETRIEIRTLTGEPVYCVWLIEIAKIDWKKYLRDALAHTFSNQRENIRMAGVYQNMIEALTS